MVAEIQMKCMSENSPIPDDDAALNASCGKFYVELTLLKYHFGLGNIAGCIERERERERHRERRKQGKKSSLHGARVITPLAQFSCSLIGAVSPTLC